MRSPLGWLLILSIWMYRWVSARINFTRNCLYRQSCSRHVEAVARSGGFVAALAAMKHRFRACRPGYTFEYDDDAWWIACVDGQAIPSAAASDVLWAEARACRVPVDSFS